MARTAVLGMGRGMSAALALAAVSVAERAGAVADDLRSLEFREVGVVGIPARDRFGATGKQKAQWKEETRRGRR